MCVCVCVCVHTHTQPYIYIFFTIQRRWSGKRIKKNVTAVNASCQGNIRVSF